MGSNRGYFLKYFLIYKKIGLVKIYLLVHFPGFISALYLASILGIKGNLSCFSFNSFSGQHRQETSEKKNEIFYKTQKFDAKHSANVGLKLQTPLIAHSNLECLLKCDRHYRSCSRLFCQYIYSFYRPLVQYIDQDSCNKITTTQIQISRQN